MVSSLTVQPQHAVEQPLGDGEGVPAAEQADQPGGLPRQEALQAEQAVDVGAPLAAARAGEVGPQQTPTAPRAVITVRDDRPLLRPGRAAGAGPAGRPFFSRASTRAWRVSSRARRRKSRPWPSRSDSQRSMTCPSGAELGGGLQLLGQGQGPLDDQALQAGSWRSRAGAVMGAS